jgi:hypothetical protein
MYPDENDHQSPEEQVPQAGPGGPGPPAPPPSGDAHVKIAYARWLAERVLQGIDSDSETARNLLYWLAQANLTLGEVVSERLGDRPPR